MWSTSVLDKLWRPKNAVLILSPRYYFSRLHSTCTHHIYHTSINTCIIHTHARNGNTIAAGHLILTSYAIFLLVASQLIGWVRVRVSVRERTRGSRHKLFVGLSPRRKPPLISIKYNYNHCYFLFFSLLFGVLVACKTKISPFERSQMENMFHFWYRKSWCMTYDVRCEMCVHHIDVMNRPIECGDLDKSPVSNGQCKSDEWNGLSKIGECFTYVRENRLFVRFNERNRKVLLLFMGLILSSALSLPLSLTRTWSRLQNGINFFSSLVKSRSKVVIFCVSRRAAQSLSLSKRVLRHF